MNGVAYIEYVTRQHDEHEARKKMEREQRASVLKPHLPIIRIVTYTHSVLVGRFPGTLRSAVCHFDLLLHLFETCAFVTSLHHIS